MLNCNVTKITTCQHSLFYKKSSDLVTSVQSLQSVFVDLTMNAHVYDHTTWDSEVRSIASPKHSNLESEGHTKDEALYQNTQDSTEGLRSRSPIRNPKMAS